MGLHHSYYVSQETPTILGKYMIIYYPNEPGTLNIRQGPSIDANSIGTAFYGDIYDVYKIINNEWIQIMYEFHIAYIKIICNGRIAVMDCTDILRLTDSMGIKGPTIEFGCRICFEDIKEKYVLLPCAHTRICKNCLDKLTECPVCREKIVERLRIYD